MLEYISILIFIKRGRNMQYIVVTGLSGAGKSSAIHILEDIGYYCIDNMPPVLMPKFAELCNNVCFCVIVY